MNLLSLSLILSLLSGSVSWSWLDETDHDFGDITHRKEVTHDFRFVNTGDTPLLIDNIRTSCGCTTPDWSDAPVAPGDTSIIQISYDARDTGYFRKLTKVYFHGKRKAEKLYIEGYVEE